MHPAINIESGADLPSPYNVLESMREYVYTLYREISKLIISLPLHLYLTFNLSTFINHPPIHYRQQYSYPN
jgi:hypothetical protein